MKSFHCLMIALLLLAIAGCNDYGEKIEVNKTDIYYTGAVTLQDAERLGDFLVAEEFIDGNPKTVQLHREEGTYQFRMVVRKELQGDQSVLYNAVAFCHQLSSQVFAEEPVEIHLCDDRLNTLRVVTGDELGERREVNHTELYATDAVTPAEAGRLLDYLAAEQFVDGSPKTTQLDRQEGTYQFRMVVKQGLDTNQDTVNLMALFAAELSLNVFDNQPVEVHMCSESLVTLRVVPMRGFGTRIAVGESEIYYTEAVTETEARRLVDYLVSLNALAGRDITIQLHREKSVYQFRMVVIEGAEKNPETVKVMEGMADELSQQVFDNQAVEVHMCDAFLKAVKVVPQK